MTTKIKNGIFNFSAFLQRRGFDFEYQNLKIKCRFDLLSDEHIITIKTLTPPKGHVKSHCEWGLSEYQFFLDGNNKEKLTGICYWQLKNYEFAKVMFK